MAKSSEPVNLRRRMVVRTALTAAATLVAGQVSAKSTIMQSVFSRSAGSFGKLSQVNAGDLNIGYVEVGPSSGRAVLLLHGWPYDIHAFADVAPLLAENGYRVIIPHLRGHGSTSFRSVSDSRNAQQAALAVDGISLLDALGIEKSIVAGFDWGARTANAMAVLWPNRCRALVSVSGYLIGSQAAYLNPLLPEAELQWWYQFYFATDRGKAGYAANTKVFNRLIWKLASPRWRFDDATFDRSAESFENPEHVAIVIHNYRWRLGLAGSESRYDRLEARLATAPSVTIPSITMEGDANGAPHPDPVTYRGKFTAAYQHRLIQGGIGHNLPQEAPKEFVQAILDVDGFPG